MMIDNPPSEHTNRSLPRLAAIDLGYRYVNSSYGLPPVSFSAEPGAFVHLAGPSGSGKSTLARCLTGLIPHLYNGELSGEVRVDGLRTTDHPVWRLAERVGMVFQNPAAQMLGTSVEEEIIFGLENLGCPPNAIRSRLAMMMDQFNLSELRHRSPRSLSGGEQQKLALAAIMARRPPVLVLDEPLSMLDVTAASELVQTLDDLSQQGTTIIIFEHRAEYLNAVPGVRRIALNGHQPVPRPDPQAEPVFRPVPPPLTLTVDRLRIQLGGCPILTDLSFTASGGETIAIVGRNGVGKTTLLRALAGLQKFEGRIAVSGEPPDLGLVYQNADLQLFNASTREEILYRVPDPDLALYQQLLGSLGLSRYEDAPPLLLSEGEKKRVALATILMRQPRHGVLLDEPSLGQDTAHKSMLMAVARALNQSGRMVIMTTHDLALASQADRLILLDKQGIVADGPPPSVLANSSAWASAGLHVPGWIQQTAQEEPAK